MTMHNGKKKIHSVIIPVQSLTCMTGKNDDPEDKTCNTFLHRIKINDDDFGKCSHESISEKLLHPFGYK